MGKLYYCSDCKRVFKDEHCQYCDESDVFELTEGAPVNIIGTKLKGKVLKIKDSSARLLIRDESNNKYIKEYEAEKLKKIL